MAGGAGEGDGVLTTSRSLQRATEDHREQQHLLAFLLISLNASAFCNMPFFLYGVGSLTLHLTPNLEDQGITLCLLSTPRPVWHG